MMMEAGSAADSNPGNTGLAQRFHEMMAIFGPRGADIGGNANVG
jgi:hypothetical protein